MAKWGFTNHGSSAGNKALEVIGFAPIFAIAIGDRLEVFLPVRFLGVGEKTASEMDDNEEKNQSTADMTQFVQDLLHQMQGRFQTMSENIVSKIDEMGSRIDELERSINDLKAEVGEETSVSPTPSAPATGKSDGAAEESS